jgi:dienelactone hydrolase
MKTLSTLGVVACLAVLSVSRAQETPASRLELATNHLKALTVRMTAGSLSDVRSLADWTQQKELRRQQLRYMLGLEPLPHRTPLQVQITGQLDRPGYRVEKLVFQSLPGLYVTGNFYLPKKAEGTGVTAQPTVLYLCGHSPHLLGAKVPYQDRGIWFASHGYPCLVLDTLEFGEVAGIHHGTHDLNMWHWLSLGYTPAGVEVWSAMRAIDYLETRPEVEPKHIGLTGISGGGAMTWYTTAVDERVAAAAPVCSTFTHGSQAEHWLASGQCDCIYYHNTFRWDFPVVAALIAPRPLLILSGQKDTIFPPDGYHDVFRRARRVYELYAGGSSERIREVDDDVAHSDPPLFLQEARQWMQRWLRNDPTPVPIEPAGMTGPLEKAEELACLSQVPSNAVNFKIQNILTAPVVLSKIPARAQWEQRRHELSRQLREKVFGWFPTNAIPFATRKTRATGGWPARYAEFKEVLFDTESGVPIRAQLFTPKETNARAPLLIHIKRDSETISGSDVDELLPAFRQGPVLVLNPRFTELPLSPSAFTDIERTAAWTGRTIAAMQIWDTKRAIDWAVSEEKIESRPIALYGKGAMGIVALYAALSTPRVTAVILNDAPASHWQGPALLNVLRLTDVAEVAAAFAPRHLISLTPFPASFDYTRALYRRGGHAASMQEAGSLPEAMAMAEAK